MWFPIVSVLAQTAERKPVKCKVLCGQNKQLVNELRAARPAPWTCMDAAIVVVFRNRFGFVAEDHPDPMSRLNFLQEQGGLAIGLAGVKPSSSRRHGSVFDMLTGTLAQSLDVGAKGFRFHCVLLLFSKVFNSRAGHLLDGCALSGLHSRRSCSLQRGQIVDEICFFGFT